MGNVEDEGKQQLNNEFTEFIKYKYQYPKSSFATGNLDKKREMLSTFGSNLALKDKK